MNRNRCGVYARVSTSDKQDYNRQIEELKILALQQGYIDKNIDVYAEAISGYTKSDNRPKLNELLLKVEENPKYYSLIYTSEISRIGRNPTQTRQIIDKLTDLGVPLFVKSLNQSTLDANGKRNMIMNIILQVLMEYANLEAETFRIRSSSGLRKAAHDGKALAGASIPYGYQRDEKGMLIIHQDESEIIKEIFQNYFNGYGASLISELLNKRGVQTRMNKTHANKIIKYSIEKKGSDIKFRDVTITSILKNTIYKGDRNHKGEVFKAPAIVSSVLFDKCQTIMKSRTKTTRNEYIYLLKNKMKCGVCGRTYFGRYKSVKGGDCVYVCSSKYGGNTSCGNAGVNIDFIESVFYTDLLNSYKLPIAEKNDSTRKKKLKVDIEKLQDEKMIEEKILKGKYGEAERINDLYVNGFIKTIDEAKSKQSKTQKVINTCLTKLESIKNELRVKKAQLENEGKIDVNLVRKMKGNRPALAELFNTWVHEVIINHLDNSSILLRVKMGYKGYVGDAMHLMLDKTALRSRYGGDLKYHLFYDLNNKIKYKNNILVSDVDANKIRQDSTGWIPKMISIKD